MEKLALGVLLTRHFGFFPAAKRFGFASFSHVHVIKNMPGSRPTCCDLHWL
jgi:hypothetical protein